MDALVAAPLRAEEAGWVLMTSAKARCEKQLQQVQQVRREALVIARPSIERGRTTDQHLNWPAMMRGRQSYREIVTFAVSQQHDSMPLTSAQ